MVKSKEYEEFIYQVRHGLGEPRGVTVYRNRTYTGRVSGRKIAVEVSFEAQLLGAHILDLVECKCYQSRKSKTDSSRSKPGMPKPCRSGIAHVDVVPSSTVMELLDADQMLYEMIRVMKPGGRVGVVVWAVDARLPHPDLPPPGGQGHGPSQRLALQQWRGKVSPERAGTYRPFISP